MRAFLVCRLATPTAVQLPFPQRRSASYRSPCIIRNDHEFECCRCVCTWQGLVSRWLSRARQKIQWPCLWSGCSYPRLCKAFCFELRGHLLRDHGQITSIPKCRLGIWLPIGRRGWRCQSDSIESVSAEFLLPSSSIAILQRLHERECWTEVFLPACRNMTKLITIRRKDFHPRPHINMGMPRIVCFQLKARGNPGS